MLYGEVEVNFTERGVYINVHDNSMKKRIFSFIVASLLIFNFSFFDLRIQAEVIPTTNPNVELQVDGATLSSGLLLFDSAFDRFSIENRILPGLVLVTVSNALIATYTATGWAVANWGLFQVALTAATAAGLLIDSIARIRYDQSQNKVVSYVTRSSQECVLSPNGSTWVCKWSEMI